MPNFDCGGDRCGEFSCPSCCDGETRKEYWALLSTGAAKSDADARRIMTARIEKRESLVKRAPQLLTDLDTARAEVARLTAEVEAMRAVADKLAVLLKGNHVGHGAFPRSGCGVCQPIDAALDALRAQKVGG